MKKFNLKEHIAKNKATFFGSLTEGYDEFKRADKGSKDVTAKDKGEEEVYGAGVKKGEEIEKKKIKKSDLKSKIKEMILAEMALDIDNMEDAPESEVDFLAELESMLNEEDEDFSVKLLVPTVYYNPETGELAKTAAAFGAASELEDMGITNYSDGDELSEWVFDNDIEKAKYFEKEYPGLFKVEGVMSEAKDEEIEDEVDVDIEDPEMMDEPTGGINVTQNANADLTGTEKEVQDNLEAALEAAKKIGDEKLQKQIGNSLTFFTRQHVVKEGYYGTTNIESYIDAIGYESFEDFFNDNPGGESVLINWIESVPEFRQSLKGADLLEGNKNLNESMFPMLKKIIK